MTPYVIACLHGVLISVEVEVAVYLINLRRQLLAVVKR
jgi:hypothetical protein